MNGNWVATDPSSSLQGSGVEWWHANTNALSGAFNYKHTGDMHSTDLTYEEAYAFFLEIGYPWILDTWFGHWNIATNGADAGSTWAFMDYWMYAVDSWDTSPPDGWNYIEDRLVPTEPYTPTEEQARNYLSDEIRRMIDRLTEVEESLWGMENLDDLDWDNEDDE